MRKRMKQTAVLAMALGMAVTGSAAGYAAADPAAVVDTAVANGVGGTKTALIGTIEITNLSVTLPLKAGFNIDPSKYDGAVDTQIGTNQSTNYKIINKSAVPVYVYISGVDVNKDHNGATVAGAKAITLKTSTTELTADYSVMLAIKDAGLTGASLPSVSTPGDWLTAAPSGIKYELNGTTHGRLEVGNTTATELNLKIYGLTRNGWAPGDKFAVAPTFTVSTTAP